MTAPSILSRHRELLLLAGFWGGLTIVALTRPPWLMGSYTAPLLWLLLVLVLATQSWRAAAFLCRESPAPIVLVAAALLFQAGASLIVTLPGLVGMLSSAGQILTVGAVHLVGSVARRRVETPRWHLPAGAGVHQMATVAGVLLIAAAGAIVSLNHLRYTVQDADSMWYHLPMVAEFIRTGSIWPPETAGIVWRAYPGFRESVLAFLALPIRAEHLAILGILEFPLLALVIYSLSGQYGASTPLAVASAAYAVTTPIIVTAFTTQKNDVSLTISFSASVLFVSLAARTGRPGYGALAGLSLGALASTKFSGVVYAGAVILAVAAAGLMPRRGAGTAPGRRPRWTWAAVGIAAAALVAGPWYLRNVLAFGNPLYPARIAVGGLVLFESPLGGDFFRATALGWDVGPLLSHWRYLIEAYGVLLPVLALGVVGLAAAFLLRRPFPPPALALLALVPLCLLAFLHQPYSEPGFEFTQNMRYMLPWFSASLLAAVAAVAAGPSPLRGGAVATVALLGGTVGNLSQWTRWWWAAVLLAGVLTACYWVTAGRRPRLTLRPLQLARPGRIAGLCLLAVLTLALHQARAERWQDEAYGYRDRPGDRGWSRVSMYVRRHLTGRRIVVHGGEYFPLYGRGFSNAIFFVPDSVSASELAAYARSARADYLVSFVPIAERRGPRDYSFGEAAATRLLEQYPQLFTIEFESDGAYVLRVR